MKKRIFKAIIAIVFLSAIAFNFKIKSDINSDDISLIMKNAIATADAEVPVGSGRWFVYNIPGGWRCEQNGSFCCPLFDC